MLAHATGGENFPPVQSAGSVSASSTGSLNVEGAGDTCGVRGVGLPREAANETFRCRSDCEIARIRHSDKDRYAAMMADILEPGDAMQPWGCVVDGLLALINWHQLLVLTGHHNNAWLHRHDDRLGNAGNGMHGTLEAPRDFRLAVARMRHSATAYGDCGVAYARMALPAGLHRVSGNGGGLDE